MPDAPPVDPEALAALRDLGGPDDPEFLPSLIRDFLKQIDETVPALARAVAAKDDATFERVAHALKGSAANLGAKPLAAIAAELQQVGREKKSAAAGPRVEALRAEAERVRAALASLPQARPT